MTGYNTHPSKRFKLRVELKIVGQEKIAAMNYQRGERIECCNDTETLSRHLTKRHWTNSVQPRLHDNDQTTQELMSISLHPVCRVVLDHTLHSAIRTPRNLFIESKKHECGNHLWWWQEVNRICNWLKYVASDFYQTKIVPQSQKIYRVLQKCSKLVLYF